MMFALLSSSGACGSRGHGSLSVLNAQCRPSKLCDEAQVNDAASAVTTVRRIVDLVPVCQEAVSVGGGSGGSNRLPSADIGITVSAARISAATKNRPPMACGSSSAEGRRETVRVSAGGFTPVWAAAPLTSGLLGSLVAIARFNSADWGRSQVLAKPPIKSRENPAHPSYSSRFGRPDGVQSENAARYSACPRIWWPSGPKWMPSRKGVKKRSHRLSGSPQDKSA